MYIACNGIVFNMATCRKLIAYISLADYCPGGNLIQYAGKDVTIQCARGFPESSDTQTVITLTEQEKKEMEKYFLELKKNYQILGVLKDKQS